MEDSSVKVVRKLTVVRHTGDPNPGHKADEDGEFRFHLAVAEPEVDSFDDAQLKLDFSGIPTGATITLDAWVTASSNIGPGKRGPYTRSRATHGDNPDTMDVETTFDITDIGNDQIGFSTGRNTASTLKAPSATAKVTPTSNSATVLPYLFQDGLVDVDTTDGLLESSLPDLDGMLTTQKDTVVIRGKIVFDDDDAGLPLESLDIQVSVDVGPSGDEDPGDSGYSGVPRFESDPITPVTVIDVDSLQTTLVASFALLEQGYNTGFAISNMNTGDEQAGAITFMLFQNGDDPIKYTTSAGSPGIGLTNGGMLAAGTTYRVLLTEIMDAAGVTGGFSGYAEITTDFTDADGIAFISDWATFSATATLEAK